jgi:peptide-methionine (S)-S-oxide reductase
MSNTINKKAFDGGYHWCTEAIFQSFKAVEYVEQDFVASTGENVFLSEAVIVHYNTKDIQLETLIVVHLYPHKSTHHHSMQTKCRSAVYSYYKTQKIKAK